MPPVFPESWEAYGKLYYINMQTNPNLYSPNPKANACRPKDKLIKGEHELLQLPI